MNKSRFRFFDLEGRTVVLTGAANGIGRELAIGLAEQKCRLLLVDRDAQRLGETREAIAAIAANPDALTVETFICDLSLPEQRAGLTTQLQEREVDAIIHNAAIDARMPLRRLDIGFFRRIMATNVEPAVELTRELLPNLERSAAGRVIMIGSITFEIGTGVLSAYVASKGALVGLTRSLAHELGSSGITVNCISPGAISVEKERARGDSHGGVSVLEEAIVSRQSIKRWLVPDDLLGPVCLLLSEAGAAITGQVLQVDGGLMHPLADPEFQSSFIEE